jgi:hypothetical protein
LIYGEYYAAADYDDDDDETTTTTTTMMMMMMMMIWKCGNECLQKAPTLNVVIRNDVIITMGHSNGVMALFVMVLTAIATEMGGNVQEIS